MHESDDSTAGDTSAGFRLQSQFDDFAFRKFDDHADDRRISDRQ
jgi:hypothetical protein